MSQWPMWDPVIEKEKEWTLGSDRADLNPSYVMYHLHGFR